MYANKIVGVVFIVLGILTAYYYGSMYYAFKFAGSDVISSRVEYQVLFLIVSGFILIFLGGVLVFKKSKIKIIHDDVLDEELDDEN